MFITNWTFYIHLQKSLNGKCSRTDSFRGIFFIDPFLVFMRSLLLVSMNNIRIILIISVEETANPSRFVRLVSLCGSCFKFGESFKNSKLTT